MAWGCAQTDISSAPSLILLRLLHCHSRGADIKGSNKEIPDQLKEKWNPAHPVMHQLNLCICLFRFDFLMSASYFFLFIAITDRRWSLLRWSLWIYYSKRPRGVGFLFVQLKGCELVASPCGSLSSSCEALDSAAFCWKMHEELHLIYSPLWYLKFQCCHRGGACVF